MDFSDRFFPINCGAMRDETAAVRRIPGSGTGFHARAPHYLWGFAAACTSTVNTAPIGGNVERFA